MRTLPSIARRIAASQSIAPARARRLVGPAATLLAVLALAPGAASAELRLPPGFVAQVYVTGDGFDPGTSRGMRGIPAASTLVLDEDAALYLGRTGRRYIGGGEVDDLAMLYRIPAGGARVTPGTEGRYLYGPPLPSPQVAAVRAGREVFVTTFNRERRTGVVYRVLDGRAQHFAGGTPPRGEAPLLRQPEGAAADSAGNLYVADRESDAVVSLDRAGRVRAAPYVSVRRPRVLAMDGQDRLWIGGDGSAEAPWAQGSGEIWRVSPDGTPALVLRGPIPAGIAVGPGDTLFVADRQGAKIFFLGPEGRRVEFAEFTDGDAPRGLVFAPDVPGTQRAGVAGDLFVIMISRGAWPINEVVRISGPFDELVRHRRSSGP